MEERMNELVTLLNRYASEYYEHDNPTVSDATYDALYDELCGLEKKLGYSLPNSPTHRVGGSPLAKFESYRHKLKLYSLDKAKTEEELDDYLQRVNKLIGLTPEMTLEYKFDGLTLSITYDKGELVTAATRGDGVVGENVTAQVKTIKTVPLTIPYKGLIEVQGEGIMRLSALAKYNETASEPLKNARNGVAGAIRNLNPKVTASRKLDFMAYNVGYSDDRFETQEDIHRFLEENGFFVGDKFLLIKDKKTMISELEKINESRDKIDFLIDGAVLKVNRIAYRDELGFTEKFPRWALAFKFPAEEATTMLRDVVWQVSRTGKLNPLAILEPVDLMGVTVKRATLNNIMDIQKKGVKKNSTVFIRRSNDVIPEITGLAERFDDSEEIIAPDFCPACGAPTRKDDVFIYCTNEVDCAPQIVAAIDHFASKPCMNIEGLSDKTIELLYNDLHIKSVDLLYELTFDDLFGLDGFKAKKASNLLDSIAASKCTTLDRFIYALGIPTIGKKSAMQLKARFNSLDNIMNSTTDEISAIPDFGLITAENVVNYFADAKNIVLVKSLLDKGIHFEEETVTEGIFSGKNVVLTGSLEKYKRSRAAEIIKQLGGSVADSISKSVNLVIVGQDAGSKLAKAEKLGIEIRDEAWFDEQIKDFL